MMPTTRVLGAAQLIAWSGAAAFAASLLWFAYSYLVRYGTAAPGPALLPILLNLALFGVFGLHHSALARSGAKAWMATHVPPELERSLYTWTASILFIIVCTLWQPVPGVLYRVDGLLALPCYAIQMLGVVLTMRGAAAVDALDLAGVRPVLDEEAGVGARAAVLETSGIYGFVRHPVYFAWVLMVFGTPVMTGTRAAFAIISTLYIAIAIPFEERSLVERFGRDYEQYQRKVRWRVVPGIY
jgi:protein-S-isoprenylcysteine O-methyltransferase Ste14